MTIEIRKCCWICKNFVHVNLQQGNCRKNAPSMMSGDPDSKHSFIRHAMGESCEDNFSVISVLRRGVEKGE